MGQALQFTDSNFQEEVLDASQPVLVDFWATWCGPCRQIAPVIEQLAAECAGNCKVGKLDVDENRDTALKYDISGIPTLIIFKNGEVFQRFTGVKSKSQLKTALDAAAGVV